MFYAIISHTKETKPQAPLSFLIEHLEPRPLNVLAHIQNLKKRVDG